MPSKMFWRSFVDGLSFGSMMRFLDNPKSLRDGEIYVVVMQVIAFTLVIINFVCMLARICRVHGIGW